MHRCVIKSDSVFLRRSDLHNSFIFESHSNKTLQKVIVDKDDNITLHLFQVLVALNVNGSLSFATEVFSLKHTSEPALNVDRSRVQPFQQHTEFQMMMRELIHSCWQTWSFESSTDLGESDIDQLTGFVASTIPDRNPVANDYAYGDPREV